LTNKLKSLRGYVTKRTTKRTPTHPAVDDFLKGVSPEGNPVDESGAANLCGL